jgi:hypothetical protein
MSKLVWDKIGEHIYETGVDRGVLYQLDAQNAFVNGVAWSGITAVNESPSGAEATALYADNIKYLNLISAEEYGLTIECYTYPDEFAINNGEASLLDGVNIGQQDRKPFGFCYRTLIGNDTEGTSKGYKIHCVYNCQASPSEMSHSTVNDSPEAANPSFEVKTTPVNVTGHKPTAVVTIDSTKVTEKQLKAIEDVLYGAESAEPRLPLPDEIATIMQGAAA